MNFNEIFEAGLYFPIPAEYQAELGKERATQNGKCPNPECNVLLCTPMGHKHGCPYMGISITYRQPREPQD